MKVNKSLLLKTNAQPPVIRAGTNQDPDARPEVVLPNELIDMVLDKLSPRDQLAAATISRRWFTQAHSKQRWAKLGAPVKDLSFDDLARLTKQDRLVQKFTKGMSIAKPIAAGVAASSPFIVGIVPYTVVTLAQQAGCIATYCSTYVGSSNQGLADNWGWSGPPKINGSNSAVAAECKAHFGDLTYRNISGPYGTNGECQGINFVGILGLLFAGGLGGAIAGTAIWLSMTSYRHSVKTKQDAGTLELGLWHASPQNTYGDIARKLKLLDMLSDRLMAESERGRIRTMPQLLALGRTIESSPEGEARGETEPDRTISWWKDSQLSEAMMLRAATLGRSSVMFQLLELGAVPSREAIMLWFHSMTAQRYLPDADVLKKLLLARCMPDDAHPATDLPKEYAVEVMYNALKRATGQRRWGRVSMGPAFTTVRTLINNTSPEGRAGIINHPFRDGDTLLHLATNLEDPDLFAYLLRQGGDPTIGNANGDSAKDRIAGKVRFQAAYERFVNSRPRTGCE